MGKQFSDNQSVHRETLNIKEKETKNVHFHKLGLGEGSVWDSEFGLR